MKRMMIFTALLLAAAGCASTAQNTTNAPAQSTNTNTTATQKTATATSEADHIAREKQVWDAIKKKDYDGFASMLADDQVEVEPEAVYDKAGSIAGVKAEDLSTATLSDFKVLKIDDDAVVVMYLVKVPTPEANAAGYRQSTVWAHRGGKWLAVFHQGTPVAAPSPSPK